MLPLSHFPFVLQLLDLGHVLLHLALHIRRKEIVSWEEQGGEGRSRSRSRSEMLQ
jgi:hypothetical protein